MDLPTSAAPRGTLLDRLMAKTTPGPNGCVIWTAHLNVQGYGMISVGGAPRLAHRVAYELLVGSIPDGLTIDHLCRVTRCINPHHMEPVTSAENTRRALQAKTHCVNGHEFTPESTYAPPSMPTRRMCRECKRDRDRQYRAARVVGGVAR
jgi:hypothetical protein